MIVAAIAALMPGATNEFGDTDSGDTTVLHVPDLGRKDFEHGLHAFVGDQRGTYTFQVRTVGDATPATKRFKI